MSAGPGIRLGRSRTVRAAALVTVGLAATACGDETPPPDTPLDTVQRQEICEAAHRRLGEDPAHCAALERVAQREHSATRPHFALAANCEAAFGAGACEGEASPLGRGQSWRPVLVGWNTRPGGGAPDPVVRDREGQAWALYASGLQPQPVQDAVVGEPAEALSLPQRSAYPRRAPVYDDRAGCEAGWGRCESTVLLNRFVEQRVCEAVWTTCTEVTLPGEATLASSSSGGGGGSSSGAHGRFIWWGSYNSGWRDRYAASYAPRWQGWGWTSNRVPVATYASRAGGAQAWDTSGQRLTPARSLASIAGDRAGSALSTRTETIARAGFGSTGRSMSAGG